MSRRWHPSRQEAMRIGQETENRVMDAVGNPQEIRPVWFIGIRRATVTEDQLGYDAFVQLDVGIVPLQIKTSTKKTSAWRKKHPDKKNTTVVISIPGHLTRDEIRDKVFLRLWKRRLEILLGLPQIPTG